MPQGLQAKAIVVSSSFTLFNIPFDLVLILRHYDGIIYWNPWISGILFTYTLFTIRPLRVSRIKFNFFFFLAPSPSNVAAFTIIEKK